MEPKVTVFKVSRSCFDLKGNEEGLTALRDAIDTKLKLKDRIQMTFATGHEPFATHLRIELTEEKKDCSNCGNKRSDSKNCLPPGLISNTIGKEPCTAWVSATKEQGCLTIEQLQRLPVKTKFKADTFISNIRKTARRAYEPWSSEEERLLRELFTGTGGNKWNPGCAPIKNCRQLAQMFQRQLGGITSRLMHLGLVTPEEYACGEYECK